MPPERVCGARRSIRYYTDSWWLFINDFSLWHVTGILYQSDSCYSVLWYFGLSVHTVLAYVLVTSQRAAMTSCPRERCCFVPSAFFYSTWCFIDSQLSRVGESSRFAAAAEAAHAGLTVSLFILLCRHSTDYWLQSNAIQSTHPNGRPTLTKHYRTEFHRQILINVNAKW